MQKPDVKVGDVVQLSPKTKNAKYAFCMLTVSKVDENGVKGYVQAPGKDGKPGWHSYYRARWGEFERIGEAIWVM